MMQALDGMKGFQVIVKELELELLQPATRASVQRLDALLADDFREVGATGHSFDKAHVLARLPGESGVAFLATEMQSHLLAPTVVLVTYVGERTYEGTVTRSRRSSVWVNIAGSWKMRYHQGTCGEPGGARNS